MDIDKDMLYRFETGLDPQDLKGSAISAHTLGYGEISAIFQIGEIPDIAFKRMPLFSDISAAQLYERRYHEYCRRLKDAGLKIPPDKTIILEVPGRPVIIYIAQEQLPAHRFVHKLIHSLDPPERAAVIEMAIKEISKVWEFNRTRNGELELALDGQLSNWVCLEKNNGLDMFYIDTSTPLYRKNRVEQLDPELLLQSAPAFLRWIIRWIFLADVMNRYYDPRCVYTDVVGNLFKEQRPDLIDPTIDIINRHLPEGFKPLTINEVKKYYREDKLIWSLFLAFRRIDRWIKTKILRKRYEFILPGKIER